MNRVFIASDVTVGVGMWRTVGPEGTTRVRIGCAVVALTGAAILIRCYLFLFLSRQRTFYLHSPCPDPRAISSCKG